MKKNSFVILGVIIIVLAIFLIVRGTRNRADDALPTTPVAAVPGSATTTKDTTNAYTPAVPLEGTTFKLVAVNNKFAPAGDYTVSFTNGKLSAKFCNGLGGEYAIKDFVIKSPTVIGTMMFCEKPEGLMKVEQLFSKMLTAGAYSTITGDVLELVSGPDKMVLQAK